MKIQVLGNSFTWFPLNDTQFLINEEMLIETPQGSSKHLLEKVDFSKIKYIIITHFHSDHFGELHLMFDWFKYLKPAHKVTVVAPKTVRKRLFKLFHIIDAPYSMRKICTYFDFVEMRPGQTVELGKYKIEAFKTEHIVKYSLGYTIQQDKGKVVGFTGDSVVCEQLKNLIKKSDVVFISTATTIPHHSHMTVDDILALHKEFPDKEFHSVHTTPAIIKTKKKQLGIPNIWDELEV